MHIYPPFTYVTAQRSRISSANDQRQSQTQIDRNKSDSQLGRRSHYCASNAAVINGAMHASPIWGGWCEQLHRKHQPNAHIIKSLQRDQHTATHRRNIVCGDCRTHTNTTLIIAAQRQQNELHFGGDFQNRHNLSALRICAGHYSAVHCNFRWRNKRPTDRLDDSASVHCHCRKRGRFGSCAMLPHSLKTSRDLMELIRFGHW